ncbi:PulJ/GspJ family protein [Pseudoalteromonas denitrificans]|uniref:Prepilin-type N-terminal cleavage/methylation domain-containing protein n=1 Tax=Pseudoalteromonas denitrificans DSM 6059 TaxID=1123010 RepID=A0A1I1JVN3_9GAMM|nr:prepilin-type N-terminal cleavage/methylation domain-containing protein [Pseudoalteromonas denitrificans]SFC52425.1 prepilin-type N-terminal cleavage/methylation domain-containing protein [Pseudoalteromonas denitrificans DSM 6059]
MTKLEYQANKNTGFTLIELMISISILTMLLFTGSYTYSMMSERWNKELGQFSQSTKIARNLELVQRLLEGVQSFVVTDDKHKPSFFFIGAQDSLLAVSRSGLFSGDYPEVFRLSTVEKQNGLVDLVYQSVSTENLLLTGTAQSIDFSHQITLFTDLNQVNFNYYGWSHLNDKAARNFKTKAKWYTHFSGINNQIMPEKFSLQLTRSNLSLSIPITLENNSEKRLSAYFPDSSL